MNKHKVYYLISGSFLFITAIIGSVYRKYIYSNMINDYGLADMHTNIGAVIVASFLFMGYMKYEGIRDELKVIIGCVLGFAVYELFQITSIIGTFDIKDVVGTIIGGIITFIMHRIINRSTVSFKD